MERVNDIKIADVIKEEKVKAGVIETEDFGSNEVLDDVEPVEEIKSVSKMQVINVDTDNSGVDAIEIESINDHFGRISDLLEGLEEVTGLSVIPLEMGHVAPEVVSLSRHKLITFGKKNPMRYAMSHHIRTDVVNQWIERIKKNLSEGVPFCERLNITVTYNGVEYKTLALSEDEWTYIMSCFRNYKEQLVKTTDDKVILAVLAERAK